MRIKKGLFLSIVFCLLAIAYVIFNTIGVSLTEKDIMHFMCTTIIVPAVLLLVYGILLGRGSTMIEVLPQISITTLVIFVVSSLSMFYMYNKGYIFDMLKNTITADNVILNINESITLGTVVQQALIFLVCTCLGCGFGSKLGVILSKIKN